MSNRHFEEYKVIGVDSPGSVAAGSSTASDLIFPVDAEEIEFVFISNSLTPGRTNTFAVKGTTDPDPTSGSEFEVIAQKSYTNSEEQTEFNGVYRASIRPDGKHTAYRGYMENGSEALAIMDIIAVIKGTHSSAADDTVLVI